MAPDIQPDVATNIAFGLLAAIISLAALFQAARYAAHLSRKTASLLQETIALTVTGSRTPVPVELEARH